MKDILVDERFRVDYKIGQGGFGLVYAGTDLKTNEEVAIKLERCRDEGGNLEYEASTYETLAGGKGVPRVLWFGHECDYYVLVQEILGPSLEDVFNYCERKFSLKTVLMIAKQCLNRVKYIHENGFLHCDIKPDNFLLGVGRNGNIIYTIDFGLAREYLEDDGRGQIDDRPMGGTARYSSVNNHKKQPHSRADDLESLGYVFLYFAHGSLPWQGLKVSKNQNKTDEIRRMKEEMPVNELCRDLPQAFADYMTYTRSLKPADKPDYAYLLKLFNTVFVENGFKYDNVFDWTEKRYYELKAQLEEQGQQEGQGEEQEGEDEDVDEDEDDEDDEDEEKKKEELGKEMDMDVDVDVDMQVEEEKEKQTEVEKDVEMDLE